MAKLLTEDNLKKIVKDEAVIKSGSQNCVEGNKYDFRLGKRILKASFKRPIDVDGLSEIECARLCVDPGEIVFVLTEETLDLPIYIKAELSLKRKLSHSGVLILGGFCIDPRYQGKLLFGIYNFASTPFLLIPGKKLIAAQFFKLSEDEISKDAPIPQSIYDFPDELIKLMDNYKPTTLGAIEKALSDLSVEVGVLRDELHSKEDWFKTFQEKLDRSYELIAKNASSIERIAESLKEENQNRKQMEKEFRDDLKEIQKSSIKSGTIIGIVAAIAVGLIIFVLTKVIPG